MQDHPSSTAMLNQRPQDETESAPQQVAPLSYTQLRLLAECAAGLDGNAANFVFTQGGQLQTVPAAEVDQTPGVLVPAYDTGKYPANEVFLQVTPTRPGGVPQGLSLGSDFADAVFWSDAAVQKFLFPYITSCAGTDASQVLAQVQAAWNHYPAARVSVYALVHVIRHPQTTTLSLDNTIHVVYAERLDGVEEPSLKCKPLGEFVAEHPPVPSPVEASRRVAARTGNGGSAARQDVAYRRGGEDETHPYQQPGYETLRALAEYACSLRHEPRYFLFKHDENGFRRYATRELPPVDAGDFVIPAYTPAVPAHRPQLHGVWCHTRDAVAANLAGTADAVFWSSGAIEQFLYPYYASKGGMQEGLKELINLSYVWMGQLPPALQPEGPTRREMDGEAAAEGGGTSPSAPVDVTGLVHVITSEYIPEAQAARTTPVAAPDDEIVSRLSPEREVGVVYAQDGRTRVSTARGFMANHWPRRG
jgi:hypothetical protein